MMLKIKNLKMIKIKNIKNEYKLSIKALLLAIVIILAEFIQIWWLSFSEVNIINFRCDARLIGNKRYKADVYEKINFIFDIGGYENKYAIMGDGTVFFNITGSSFTYSYDLEGIYNVSLTALGIGGFDTDWLIIEVENDEPGFDIGYSSVEYHEATYDFEGYDVDDIPGDDWNIYNNEHGFYLDEYTNLYPGNTLTGGIEDLTTEDQQTWDIQSEWTGGNFRYIEMNLHFNQSENHEMVAGQYELYFSANDSMALYGYNPSLGENEILFKGNYTNGQLITISYPNSLELFTSYYIENWGQEEVIAIDWFKLVRVYKGAKIINDEYDHGKVIELTYDSQNCGISTSFSNQLYGTIEFWYRTKDTSIGGKLYSNLLNVGIIQKDNKWFVGTTDITDPALVNPVPEPKNNTWHHIRIDWNNGIPSYQGLGERFFSLYIDNEKTINFIITEINTGLNQINFETNEEIMIDAIGYSWDENYAIGGNLDAIYPEALYEDLEIKFSMLNLEESEFDKKGFSFNSESEISSNFSYIWDFGDGNYSYDESPTHKFQNTGDFPVRLTLVDDQGAMCTKVKNFHIENKEPNAEITYGLNYKATYDFKYDVSNRPPSDWYTHGDIKVVDYKDEFSKVVEIDTLKGGYSLIRIPEPDLDLNGSIEYWVYFSDVKNDEFFFWIDKLPYSESNPFVLRNSTRFGYLNGKWMRYYTYKGPSDEDRYAYEVISELALPKNNEWIHVRFDYCWSDMIEYQGLTGKQWRIYVNGNASNIYEGVGDTFNRKGFDIRSGSHIYLESVGFTTDPEYSLGDNNPERVKSYYGTWDFRFYPNGAIPYDQTLEASVLGPWMFGSYNFQEFADGCGAYIIPELDEHLKVLELEDHNSSDLVFASLIDLSDATYGTLEFWLRTTDVSQGLAMAFGHEVFDTGIWLTNDGNWAYKNGKTYVEISDIPQMENNKWHNIRVDFDCRGKGGYLDLGEDEFYFAVDGNYSNLGPFKFSDPVSDFGWNIWSTLAEGNNYSIYLDAIGASWDPAYEIGDNKAPREAILTDTEIIFSAKATDTPTDLQGLKYLWNFGDNQTAFGQTVLHTFTRSGKYKVKLLVLDDNGLFDTYESYIWIDNQYPSIRILDINYGYATYEFSTNDVGEFPDGWYSSTLENLYKKTEIVGNVDGFSKVVQIGNGPGFGGMWTSDLLGVPYNQTQAGDLTLFSGTIELWLYCTDTSQAHIYLSLFEDSYLDGIFLEFNNGIWSHDSIPLTFDNSWELQNNTWTHLRIDFSCDDSGYMGLENDTFILFGDDYSSQTLNMTHFNHTDISNMTCFGIFSEMGAGEYSELYVDNIGFSWDPEYDVGDNKVFYLVNQFREGETIILDCLSYDTFTDYQQLIYTWGDLYLDFGAWEDFGWHYSYTFTDNDDGDALEGYPVVSFIGDPLYAWDIDSYYMDVDNVLPSLSIHTASVKVNISAEIYNYGLDAANFTIIVSSPSYEDTLFSIDIPTDYSKNLIDLNSTLIKLDISEDWTLIVNQTGREGGTHDVILNFEFENGYQYQKTLTFDGIESILSFNLNEMWIDVGNNTSLVPLTFDAILTDPSDDKIKLSIDYINDIIYSVDYSTPLITRSYLIEHEPNDINCNLTVFEDSGVKYAQFSFINQIPDNWTHSLTSGIFPVSYRFSFDVDLTDFDFHQFIADVFSTENINFISHESTNYTISAKYNEIQPSSEVQKVNVNYVINNYFLFENMAPSIIIQAPVNVSEDQLVCYYADVKDFNKDALSVSISFGINSGKGLKYRQPLNLSDNLYGFNYTYTNAGSYLIYVNVTDGKQETRAIHLIEVTNVLPYAIIRTYQNVTYEDDFIEFTADLYDTPSDVESLRYYWDFGDGVFSAEENPFHAYFQAGFYTVRLHIRDDNGGGFCATYNLTVLDQPPEILGPFTFFGSEGQTLMLDVDVSESFSDYIMDYTWEIYKAKRMYNATFDFIEFNEGSIPTYPNFDYDPVADITYQVVDDLSTHYKVLEIEDNNALLGGSWRLRYGDSGSTSGSVEFWLRASYIAPNLQNLGISLLESGTNIIPIFINENGTWVYHNIYTGNSTIINSIPQLESNRWHHVRIDFECSTGNYLGLDENSWRISVDGVSSDILSMQFNPSPPDDDVDYLDTLEINSGTNNIMSIYCDAIGYYNNFSQYQLGDNLNQIIYRYDYLKTIYGENPSVAFNEGTYLIDLLVENDLSSHTEITLEINNIGPMVTVSSKKYEGGVGYIELNAYALDSFIDSESLEFEWLIEGERQLIEYGSLSSSLEVLCDGTKTIRGKVKVRDPLDLVSSSDFFVQIFMDSNGDGFTDEFEEFAGLTSIDMDGDGLPNFFEDRYLETDMWSWDTDDDGLGDGYDSHYYFGELSVGTDPLDNDTDDDLLLDGIEWIGWNHSIVTSQGKKIVNYSSNPLKKDTDNDLLDDYQEFIAKTNPRVADTDNDGLTDYEEVMIHKSNPNNPDTDDDGLLDGIEVEIGTHYNNSDTDGDGIQDGAEYLGWGFITDPLSSDSDNDYLVDSAETLSYHYEIDGRKSVNNPVVLTFDKKKVKNVASAQITFLLTYGETIPDEFLSDITVRIFKQDSELILYDKVIRTNNEKRYLTESIDIKQNMAGSSYYGNYILKVSYMNELHGELCLEEYSMTVNRFLDPNKNDYDRDGIMDGVETQLIVPGIEKTKYNDLLNITSDTNSTTFNIFDIDISDVGIINDADIYFTIVSNNTLLGNGNVSVIIIQKDLDYRVKDLVIPLTIYNFSTSDDFLHTYHFKPNSIEPHIIPGQYRLIFDIYDDNEADVFNVIDIKVLIDGFRQANSSDTEAWITQPDNSDTDGDGWSDAREIYKENTSPLSWDTDGDHIKDSRDLFPLYNMVIEIQFIEGHVGDLPKWYVRRRNKPYLQMTCKYSFHGESLAFVSPHVRASKDTEYAGEVFKKSYKGTSVFGQKYYIDVEDSWTGMFLSFQLWDEGLGSIDQYWDTRKEIVPVILILRSLSIGDTINVGSESGTNWLTAKIRIRGLSHANTIAVYDNDTIFNGHYNKVERMNIFQLTVTEPPSSESPFVEGMNTILIPTSAFLNSQLNHIIQNKTALANSFLAKGEFISLDRENLPDSASKNIESIFVIECSIAEADLILEWAANGIINHTTNQTGIINKFASTRQDNFRVELMNVHPDVLELVPLINPYSNSKQGSMPKDDGEWWADLAKKVVDAIYGIFIEPLVKLVKLIAAIIEAVVEFIAAVVKAVIEAIIAIILLIVKALLYVYIWLMFGLSLLILLGILAIFAGIFYAILQIITDVGGSKSAEECEFEYTGLGLMFEVPDMFLFDSEIVIGSKYDDFIGLDIPTLEFTSIIDIMLLGIDFEIQYEFSVFELDIEIIGFPFVEDWGNTDFLVTLLDLMGATMSLSGASYTAIGLLLALSDPASSVLKALASIGAFILALLGLILVTIPSAQETGEYTAILWGLAFGFIISGAFIVAPTDGIKNATDSLSYAGKKGEDVLDSIDSWLEKIGFTLGEAPVTDKIFSVISGLIALISGGVAVSAIKEPSTKKIVQYTLGIICFVLGTFFLIQALIEENENE